jgi:hypothetical protein
MGERSQDASPAQPEGRYAHLSPSHWLWLALHAPRLYTRLSGYRATPRINADPIGIPATQVDRPGASRCPSATEGAPNANRCERDPNTHNVNFSSISSLSKAFS